MLDRLPLELLDELLDQLPSPSSRKHARERTNALLACCLVSTHIERRAVHFLWRDIRMHVGKEAPDFVNMVEAGAEASLVALARTFVIQAAYGQTSSAWERTLAVLPTFSSSTRLTVYGYRGSAVNLKRLAIGLPLLADLRLSDVVVAPCSTTTVFPTLRSLTLTRLSHAATSLQSLPSAENCPALRALVVNPHLLEADDPQVNLLGSLDHRLACQLDMLQVPGEYAEANSMYRLLVETLVTIDPYDLKSSIPSVQAATHLRLVQGSDSFSSDTVIELARQIGPTSRSLHLPSTLRPSKTPDNLIKPVSDLLARCTALVVDVFWYDPSEEDYFNLSSSFWRYAKRLKA